MYTIKVSKEDFEKIKSGERSYVFMINKDIDIFVGDHILFKKLPELFDGVLTKIVDKKTFSSFYEMATILSLEELGFGGMTNTEVEKYCEKNFDKTLVEEHGVVVFKFDLTE